MSKIVVRQAKKSKRYQRLLSFLFTETVTTITSWIKLLHTFRADRVQDNSRLRRGGLCAYIINARCSNTVRFGGQCSPNVRLLMWSCWPYYHQHLVAVVYIHPDADERSALQNYFLGVHVFIYVYSLHIWIYVPGYNLPFLTIFEGRL